MSVTRSAGWVVAIIASLQGIANAEFQTFSDESSYLAALSAGPDGTSPDGVASAAGDTLQSPGSGGWSYTGPSLVFSSSSPWVGASGWFGALTGGTISAFLDDVLIDTIAPSTSGSGFWGVVLWQGFQNVKLQSSPDLDWGVNDWSTQSADSVVPEPGSLALFGMGAVALLGYRSTRRKKLVGVETASH